MRIGRDDVRAHLRAPKRLLIDLRSPEEYSGERVADYSFKTDHGAERGGRIPGAVHLYFKELLNDDDSFKSPAQLRDTLAAAGIRPEKFDEFVCYCRLSHRATIGWLALGANSRAAQRQDLRRLVDRMGQHRRFPDREVARGRQPSAAAAACASGTTSYA